ncbi:MAG: hypothetical protein CMJ48_13275 [Planctomycetaceae bacterium]|nr:hypothetical protein [Planctomycetaceae bacterium]
MLTAGDADFPRLPQTDLVYVAFRLCYFDLLADLESEALVEALDFDDVPYGFLTQVPFLEAVPPTVELDLLASVWGKHHSQLLQPAYLLDAAVLWSIFNGAGKIAMEVWDGDLSLILKDGPRQLTVKVDAAMDEQWKEMYEDFWDDVDFLSVGDMQDMPPDKAKALRERLCIPEEWVDEMVAVLNRARASEAMLGNLKGLLTDTEIADHRSLLLPETP